MKTMPRLRLIRDIGSRSFKVWAVPHRLYHRANNRRALVLTALNERLMKPTPTRDIRRPSFHGGDFAIRLETRAFTSFTPR
jgi:hypothetical protein